ncbi:DUF4229 domain-containing protein [Jannaschia sp. R86511]|uniref:DUF4229 domain-containing protein n=1 Tax=Jannaschia sp. R86511 TaxID=3093853 RepID=UPI0036D28D34
MRPVAVYSALRLGLFLLALLLLRAAGVGGVLSLVIALVLAMLLSFLVLRRQRDAVTRALMARRQQAQSARTATGGDAAPPPRTRRSRWSFSGRLAEDAAVEDAAVDGTTRPGGTRTDDTKGGTR